MSVRIAINGFGRIGRSILRAARERADTADFEIIAINEPSDPESIALLTRYDSQHGRLNGHVWVDKKTLCIDQQRIQLLGGQPIASLPWGALKIDLVLECSGQRGTRETAEAHLRAGAKRVVFSQPASADVDITLIPGFNDHERQIDHQIISAGSCTTHCIIPVLDTLQKTLGLKRGTATTIHAAMNDQPVTDTLAGADPRRHRSAMNAVIPVDTALAKGISRLMPELAGHMECLHLRIPTTTVSAMDLTLESRQATTSKTVLDALSAASENQYAGIMAGCADPVSSIDFAHDPHSTVIDQTQLRVVDEHLIKVLCWFDNEWGFANRMVDIALAMSTDAQSQG
ncbi:MAG: glyceraldehyde 3-phosphate dehydrogenase NAD-binding domain-containing protein [Spiribacter sp.]|jgi:D-erythrose 4-phosphate dehydrogenase|nr:glyceraldehyde 3-phosphate dehydrogenase NAD-binding domain-containing protein [Spiribacter sp.]MDR9489690.1 glyceraldehyde 3-phosphate dehydrogenase NAD-binding domain-containing protein [Spiribacter sp.]